MGDASYLERVTINMVEISKDYNMAEFENENQIEVVYPKAGEGLLEFLHRCKVEDSKVILCPWCNVVFDKNITRKVESTQQEKKNENWRKNRPRFYFDKREVSREKEQFPSQ